MPVNDPSSDSAARPGAAALDPEALLHLQRLDPHGRERLFERLAAAFELLLQRLQPGLDSALSSADPAAIATLVHTLKSAAAALGALNLAAECAAIETQVSNGVNGALLSRVQQLRDDLPAVLVTVQALVGTEAQAAASGPH
jgi:HPt (histidine-containing phosphotransfer) domain-containing protein